MAGTIYGLPSDGSIPGGLTDAFAPRPPLPTAAAVSGEYDPVRSLYNFHSGQLERARAALGKAFAGTGEARIAFLGDSTTAGVGAGAGQNWPAQLVTKLTSTGYKSTGTGIVASYKASADDPRWVKTSGWGAMSSVTSIMTNNTTNTPATFTSDTPGTIARVHYSRRSSSPFTVSIDGGAPVTVTADGTTNEAGVYEVAGLPDTTHTIAIARVATDTKYVQIFGAEVASGTTGIRTYNAAIGGGKLPTSGQNGWWAVDQYSSSVVGFNADLAFVMYETNDAGAGTPLVEYKTALNLFVSNLKTRGADVVMVTAVPSSLVDYAGGGGDLAAYTAVQYEVAEEQDVPLIDLQDRMGTYERNQALGLMNDKLHPTAAGYAVVANAVAGALGLV